MKMREDNTMEIGCKLQTVPTTIDAEALLQKGSGAELLKMKDRQSRKIRQLRDALAAEGFVTLDEQAKALGLHRSTTWTILKGNHKGSGLSATTINHILLAPQMPSVVRAKILEYVEEKADGLYGHSKEQRSRFIARLSAHRSLDQLPDAGLEPYLAHHAYFETKVA